VGYLTISTMLAVIVIKHVVDDNAICLSTIQLMHEPAHGVRNTVQQLLCKTQNFSQFLLSYGPNGPELNQLITIFGECTAP